MPGTAGGFLDGFFGWLRPKGKKILAERFWS